MNQSEKELILVKLQEITNIIRRIPTKVEVTLFDNVEASAQEDLKDLKEIIGQPVCRKRIQDGTMTASMIALKLSKELGREVTKENVISLGKQCGAESSYSARQHVSRYTPESVKKIMNIYRCFR